MSRQIPLLGDKYIYVRYFIATMKCWLAQILNVERLSSISTHIGGRYRSPPT